MTAVHARATVTTPGDREILITREFDAPAALVWRAWTEPDLVRQWWTSKRGEMSVCEIDLRVGGAWRYVMHTPDGFEVGFHGEYMELVPGERMVSTEAFEGMPGAAPSVNTMTLVEHEGRTQLEIHVLHAEAVHRDAHIGSGMEAGLQDGLELLEQVALSLR